jgi:hypothetical protein
MENTNSDIGAPLRQLRVRKDLILHALGEKLGSPEISLSRLEIGTLERIMDILDHLLFGLTKIFFPYMRRRPMRGHLRLLASPGLEYALLTARRVRARSSKLS